MKFLFFSLTILGLCFSQMGNAEDKVSIYEKVMGEIEGKNGIFLATEKGDIQGVRMALIEGEDVNAITDEGETALLTALRRGHFDIVRLLLKSGVDPDLGKQKEGYFFSSAGNRPLHYAVFSGRKDIVEALISKGAYLDITDKYGATPLHDVSGDSIHRFDPKMARFLVKKGANPNAQNDEGITPFHLVSGFGHTDTIRLFIEHGGRANLKSRSGHTPLHFATTMNVVVKNLTKEIKKDSEAMSRIDTSFKDIIETYSQSAEENVKLILFAGADINEKDDQGLTALDLLRSQRYNVKDYYEKEMGKKMKGESYDEWFLEYLYLPWIECAGKMEKILKDHGATGVPENVLREKSRKYVGNPLW